ncbi:hypothetical protein JHK85_023043 [Glycine max]|nr:hypothetical protein JHK87_022460 [Glycine soja]KAG5016907.1 hypothetical protein JHK85_023043 [Glycine max]KAG5026656.1 hypothetical protein JHK86_022570 [Glycine max]
MSVLIDFDELMDVGLDVDSLSLEDKSLMSTCEDLDDSSSDEDNEEEDNQYLMVDASTSKVEPALDASLDDEDP